MVYTQSRQSKLEYSDIYHFHFIDYIYRVRGISTTSMPGPALTGTSPASLLQQCVSAQHGIPPLLKREFRPVGAVKADGDNEGRSDCIRVMTWNTLADGKVIMMFVCLFVIY